MRSARSWFNLTLFRKNMTRFWPIWGLYLVIWLFAMPIMLVLENYGRTDFADWTVLRMVTRFGVVISFLFAIAAAMAVWSYLYNHRSVGLMHTLPIRREGLFLTNYLSGLAFFVGPNLAVFLLTLLAEGAYGVLNAGALVSWLVSMTLMELFFFSFATFCALFTGHLVCLPIYYGILTGLPAGVLALTDLALSRFVFGYTGISSAWNAVQWLTPPWKLFNELYITTQWGTPWLSGMGYIILYALLGLVLAAVALLIYRRRDMERAGDVVAVSWVRPIFQYGVGFCCALAFGTLLFEMFRFTMPDTAWTMLFFMLLCGAVGFFLARMLLEKSFRVFRKRTWGLCGCLLAALVLLVCAMEFDLTGFERRVPDADRVASVYLDTDGPTWPIDEAVWSALSSTDPEVIEQVVALHRSVAGNESALKKGLSDLRYDYWTNTAGYDVMTGRVGGFSILYHLRNGKEVRRNYSSSIPISSELLSDPDSPAARLQALLNMPQMVLHQYGLDGKTEAQLSSVELSGVLLDTTKADRAALYQAILADIEAGDLGRRYLLEDQERMENNYTADLTLYFISPGEVVFDETSVTYPNGIDIGLQVSAKNTLAVLEELGVDVGALETLAQAQLSDPDREDPAGAAYPAGADTLPEGLTPGEALEAIGGPDGPAVTFYGRPE